MKKLIKRLSAIAVSLALLTGIANSATTLFPYQGGTGTGTAPTSGQVLIGTSDGKYVPATIAEGTGIDITTGSGTMTIATSGMSSGTVTDVSVVSANGFAGTVATSTTTPAITLSTSVTGILKGNGTAISAATDGTDYLSSSTGLKLDQTTPQNIVNGIPLLIADVADFTSGSHVVNKEYVDQSISFIEDFYLNNTASDIGGIYYQMLDTPTGQAGSTFVSGTLTTGNNQTLVNFATIAGVPGVTTLRAGTYSAHIHASVDAILGSKNANILYQIYSRTSGGTETLLSTSELSGNLTTTADEFDLHSTIATDTTIAVTDRIVIKWLVNVTGSGNDVVVTLYAENDYASRLSIPTGTDILSSVFLRQDGTKPLTANWNAGNFSVQLGTIELGHATENTLSASGGVLSIEGTAIPKGTGTSNEIAYWSGTNTLGTLAVATYPSLTELSYVKGVTSAIQTQIGALVPKSLYDAHSILYATTDDTPVALTVGTQTVVGRAGGNITALAIDSDLSSVSANDDTVPSAKATKAMGDLKLPLGGGTMTGNLLFTDNTLDIGANGATRPRTGYFGTSIVSPVVNATTGVQINGGATSGKILKGNGTNFVASTETYAAPGTSGNVMTSDGTNWTSAAPTGGGGIAYAADAGASDAYAITVSPAPASYIAGDTYLFRANTANTDGATLNINSLGAIPILKKSSTVLANNDILSGQMVLVSFNEISGATAESYSESNVNAYYMTSFANSGYFSHAQAFQVPTTGSYKLTSNKFYLKKFGSPTGNMTAKLYASTGSLGTTAKPTGEALATSDALNIADLTTTATLIEFTFSGVNQYIMQSGVIYEIAIDVGTNGDGSNYVQVGYDSSTPTHAGNAASTFTDQTHWGVIAGQDLSFYIYGTQMRFEMLSQIAN